MKIVSVAAIIVVTGASPYVKPQTKDYPQDKQQRVGHPEHQCVSPRRNEVPVGRQPCRPN